MKLMHIRMVVMFSLCLSLNLALAQPSGDLNVSGTTTTTDLISSAVLTKSQTVTKDLKLSHLDCTTSENGGALTTDAAGVVSCSDDDSLQQLAGDPVFVGKASGWGRNIYVSGRYAYQLGTVLNIFDVTDPSVPRLVGSVTPCPPSCIPNGLFVSGRYAYTLDDDSGELLVIDVSDPSDPFVVGKKVVGSLPDSIYVMGRYAYVIDLVLDELIVVDVSDPVSPSVVGRLIIGGNPRSIFVSGKYAYLLDTTAHELKIIDVSDPESPGPAGSFGLGASVTGWSIYVSGSYAYVPTTTFLGPSELRVFDISDPSATSLVDNLVVGEGPTSVFVSGSYVYIVTSSSDELIVVDASDPTALSLAGSVDLLTTPAGSTFNPAVYVAGRYAYVADSHASEIKVFDVSGVEFPSLIAHSLEAGNLQVRNDIIAQGQLQVTGGVNVGAGGIFSDGNVGISGTIALANDEVPTLSPDNLVQLYAENESGSSELKVRDEAGVITTLSPHNFSLVGQPSEPLAWSFYSENDSGKINVDMLHTVRLVEAISGQKLVYTQMKEKTGFNTAGNMDIVSPGLPSIDALQSKLEYYQQLVSPLIEAVQELKQENEALNRRLEVLEKKSD